MQGIKFYESHLESFKGGALELAWSPDIIALLQQEHQIYEGYVIAEAKQTIAGQHLFEIIDAIRNKLLDFALELEKDYPAVSKSDTELKGIPSDKVTNTFHLTVYGGQQNFASGSHFSQTSTQNVNQGSLEDLRAKLKNLEVPEEEVKNLELAIREDEATKTDGELGENVKQWIATFSANVAGGTVTTALVNLPEVITAIHQFLGLVAG